MGAGGEKFHSSNFQFIITFAIFNVIQLEEVLELMVAETEEECLVANELTMK